jgi:hypothetical protein
MARVSKDGDGLSCFETALTRLLSMWDNVLNLHHLPGL